MFNEDLDLNTLIGKSTLLFGESNTKKTYFTAKFIQFLLTELKVPPETITILDFAPKLFKYYNLKIGGRIEDYYPQSIKCKYLAFTGEIIPPRLNASNKKDLYHNACSNYKKTYEILTKYLQNPTHVLIINDLSIYLHLGNKYILDNAIKQSNTFFGNTYYGKSIAKKFSILFSLKERLRVEFFINHVDFAYSTDI